MGKRDIAIERILTAARQEFSAHGFAGARIARIAVASACNKQAIYAYVGDKESLWQAIYSALIQATIDAVPLNARDLPGYAGHLFDHYREHPETLRLSFWYALEQSAGVEASGLLAKASAAKIAAIAQAQADGHVTRDVPADSLLALVLRLSMASESPPEGVSPAGGAATVRAAIVAAVDRLVKP